jgi:hypothetical protein
VAACMQEIAEVVEVQVTGPESELKSLEDTLAAFNPTYFYAV